MTGVLDFLQTPEAQLGIGLLAAGGPSSTPMNVGQRVQMAMQGIAAQRQNDLKTKLLESQIAENTSQDALRRAQLERQSRQDAYFLGSGFGSPSAGTAPVSLPGTTPAAVPTTSVGTPAAGGAVLKAAVGAPADAPPPPQGKFAEWSKQFNIPVDALVADYLNNGGKSIAEMLYKRGTPDMQVTNGYAYDKNKVQPGYLPSLNISSNGQATQVQIGPDGQPVVSAPRGAVDTFGQYQATQDRSKAAFTPGRPVILPGGRMGGQSQLAEITGDVPAPTAGTLGERNNNPGNLRPPGASTGFQQFPTPEAGLAALDQNLQAYGKRGINTIEGVVSRWAPSNENNTAAYVKSVAGRLGIPANQPIDLNNPYVRQALTTAIMLQENGTGILTRGAGAAAPQVGAGAGRGSINPSSVDSLAGGGLEFSPAEQATIDANKKFQTGIAEAAASNVKDSQAAAQSAASTLQNVQQIRSGLDKALLGPGAKIGMALYQVGQSLGVGANSTAETLSNTRNVIQGLARQELAAAGQMKGQGQITENERGILRRAEAGEIDNFTKPELMTLMSALEKTANYRLQSHENLLARVNAGQSPTDLMQVQRPPAAAPSAPSATMRFNPSTGKIEKVQ